MIEFEHMFQSIWLGLKGRTNMSRIVLSWIGNGLLKP
jgi:hypothetical protein